MNLLDLFGRESRVVPRGADASQFLVDETAVGKGNSTGWEQGCFSNWITSFVSSLIDLEKILFRRFLTREMGECQGFDGLAGARKTLNW